jgi:hypothetical protein
VLARPLAHAKRLRGEVSCVGPAVLANRILESSSFSLFICLSFSLLCLSVWSVCPPGTARCPSSASRLRSGL